MMTIQTPQERLKFFFERNGYLRFPDPIRQDEEGHTKYKKGYEARLVAHDDTELAEIRSLLEQTDFKLANSHVKANRHIQPIYGKEAVERFCKMIGKEIKLTEGE